MSEQAKGASVEVEAKRMVRSLRRRGDFAGVIGIFVYAALEVVRHIYWPDAGKWTVVGWLIPFEGLTCFFAYVSYESMKSSLKELGYSGETAHREQTLILLIQRQDAEGLRLVRGMATAGGVYAFVIGMVMSGIVRTYFFN